MTQPKDIDRKDLLTYTKSEWKRLYGRDNWAKENGREDIDKMSLQKASQLILKNVDRQKAKMQSEHTPKMSEMAFISDGMNLLEFFVKRLIGILISTCCLLIFSPLFLICYIMIKMDDGGPALYKQERIGLYGKPFNIYKFRSMKLNAEEEEPLLCQSSLEKEGRLTKAGAFLRAHHLDELPQLWNVFIGDMAFIGYRPERQYYINKILTYDPRYVLLYQIRPGVTSYATLYNGYTDTMEKMLTRLDLDLYYLKHRSWWFDLKILFLTFWKIINGIRF